MLFHLLIIKMTCDVLMVSGPAHKSIINLRGDGRLTTHGHASVGVPLRSLEKVWRDGQAANGPGSRSRSAVGTAGRGRALQRHGSLAPPHTPGVRGEYPWGVRTALGPSRRPPSLPCGGSGCLYAGPPSLWSWRSLPNIINRAASLLEPRKVT